MGADADGVLEYFPERRGPDNSVAGILVLLAPLLAGTTIAAAGLPKLAIAAAAGVALYMLYQRRRQKSRPRARLWVEAGRLRVSDADARVLLDTSLEELVDVSLDTKTIERVQENAGSPIPDLRFINSVVSAPIDTSRIEIEALSGSIYLTDEYVSNIDSTEWFGKIRRLLRRHGWVPLDERP